MHKHHEHKQEEQEEQEQQEQQQHQEDQERQQEPAAAEGAPAADPYAQLGELKGLLDSGAITQDEFDAQKQKILGS